MWYPNRKAYFKDYDEKIAELDKKYKGKMSDILDFLYESDCDAEMDADHCPIFCNAQKCLALPTLRL